MTSKASRSNPYIAGRALGRERGFFGREDILQLVETSLVAPDRNVLVLFGQRRIGKTSILLQLQRRLPSPPFLPVYFDLMDRARRPLGQVLFEIAATIAAEADMAQPEQEQFDDQGFYFRGMFLPSLYEVLGEGRSPVLLLDEFDVLDVAAEEQLSSTTAAQAFFPYLRELLDGEPRLKFVFVVGRRAEDLSINVKATFKASLYKRVSVLDEASARELIATGERQGTLTFTSDAVNRILSLTSGHPYFVQLLCQIMWSSAHAADSAGVFQIDVEAVETAATKVLEVGQNVFEWIWDGLPPAERVIFAAIAEATDEQSMVTEEHLVQLLQSHGIRILTRELELAPRTLVEWEMLRHVDGGYKFFIELMRRWVVIRKPLPKVKEELDRIVPLADMLYRGAYGFYRQRDLESALRQLHESIRVNPNHLKARLLLGQVLFEQNSLDDAVKELEEAYKNDEDAARYQLIKVLLAQGQEHERLSAIDQALEVYKRALAISPREKVALERIKVLNSNIEIPDQKINIKEFVEQAQIYEKREEWDKAAEIYTLLIDRDSRNEQWSEDLERVKTEQELKEKYLTGLNAFNQGNWDRALRLFADVVYVRPEYKDVAELLSISVNNKK